MRNLLRMAMRRHSLSSTAAQPAPNPQGDPANPTAPADPAAAAAAPAAAAAAPDDHAPRHTLPVPPSPPPSPTRRRRRNLRRFRALRAARSFSNQPPERRPAVSPPTIAAPGPAPAAAPAAHAPGNVIQVGGYTHPTNTDSNPSNPTQSTPPGHPHPHPYPNASSHHQPHHGSPERPYGLPLPLPPYKSPAPVYYNTADDAPSTPSSSHRFPPDGDASDPDPQHNPHPNIPDASNPSPSGDDVARQSSFTREYFDPRYAAHHSSMSPAALSSPGPRHNSFSPSTTNPASTYPALVTRVMGSNAPHQHPHHHSPVQVHHQNRIAPDPVAEDEFASHSQPFIPSNPSRLPSHGRRALTDHLIGNSRPSTNPGYFYPQAQDRPQSPTSQHEPASVPPRGSHGFGSHTSSQSSSRNVSPDFSGVPNVQQSPVIASPVINSPQASPVPPSPELANIPFHSNSHPQSHPPSHLHPQGPGHGRGTAPGEGPSATLVPGQGQGQGQGRRIATGIRRRLKISSTKRAQTQSFSTALRHASDPAAEASHSTSSLSFRRLLPAVDEDDGLTDEDEQENDDFVEGVQSRFIYRRAMTSLHVPDHGNSTNAQAEQTAELTRRHSRDRQPTSQNHRSDLANFHLHKFPLLNSRDRSLYVQQALNNQLMEEEQGKEPEQEEQDQEDREQAQESQEQKQDVEMQEEEENEEQERGEAQVEVQQHMEEDEDEDDGGGETEAEDQQDSDADSQLVSVQVTEVTGDAPHDAEQEQEEQDYEDILPEAARQELVEADDQDRKSEHTDNQAQDLETSAPGNQGDTQTEPQTEPQQQAPAPRSSGPPPTAQPVPVQATHPMPWPLPNYSQGVPTSQTDTTPAVNALLQLRSEITVPPPAPPLPELNMPSPMAVDRNMAHPSSPQFALASPPHQAEQPPQEQHQSPSQLAAARINKNSPVRVVPSQLSRPAPPAPSSMSPTAPASRAAHRASVSFASVRQGRTAVDSTSPPPAIARLPAVAHMPSSNSFPTTAPPRPLYPSSYNTSMPLSPLHTVECSPFSPIHNAAPQSASVEERLYAAYSDALHRDGRRDNGVRTIVTELSRCGDNALIIDNAAWVIVSLIENDSATRDVLGYYGAIKALIDCLSARIPVTFDRGNMVERVTRAVALLVRGSLPNVQHFEHADGPRRMAKVAAMRLFENHPAIALNALMAVSELKFNPVFNDGQGGRTDPSPTAPQHQQIHQQRIADENSAADLTETHASSNGHMQTSVSAYHTGDAAGGNGRLASGTALGSAPTAPNPQQSSSKYVRCLSSVLKAMTLHEHHTKVHEQGLDAMRTLLARAERSALTADVLDECGLIVATTFKMHRESREIQWQVLTALCDIDQIARDCGQVVRLDVAEFYGALRLILLEAKHHATIPQQFRVTNALVALVRRAICVASYNSTRQPDYSESAVDAGAVETLFEALPFFDSSTAGDPGLVMRQTVSAVAARNNSGVQQHHYSENIVENICSILLLLNKSHDGHYRMNNVQTACAILSRIENFNSNSAVSNMSS